MPRAMFGDLVVSSPGAARRHPALVALSLGAHGLTLLAAVLLPRYLTASLGADAPPPGVVIWRPTAPPAALAHAEAAQVPAPPPRARHDSGGHRPARIVLPTVDAPPSLPDAEAETLPPSCLVGCGTSSGGATGVEGDASGPPTAMDGRAAEAAPAIVNVSAGVKAPAKRRHVNPVYPEVARLVGAQGHVIVECIIDTEGRVAEARVVSGPPLLTAAALDAVRQWLYTPTLLNGRPVAVRLTVTVTFGLHR